MKNIQQLKGVKMKNKKEIFKYQQDFTSSLCLVYNKDRSIMGQFPLDEELENIFNGEMKFYAWATYDDNTGETIIDRKCTEEETEKIFW